MLRRKICVVVTARPSYSRIKTALKAIQDHPDLELQLVVAGSALLDRYGTAVEYIIEDGFKIQAKVFNTLEGENLSAAAKTTGIGILELSTVFENLQPTIVVTIADRYETMATAVAASYMNIPLAHIQGGEVTGNIDEKVRHSITKLSDYHFVSSSGARDRVLKLGENPDFVFNTGCPSIDLASDIKKNNLDFNPYDKYEGVGDSPDFSNGYIVVMQHPVTNEYEKSRIQINETLSAIRDIDITTFWFWPNVDAGSDGTSKGIRSFREENEIPHVHFFKNMKPKDFLILLNNSKMLIGNSSVGIRECAYLAVPSINIGSRQFRRDKGNNVMNVDYKKIDILKAIDYFLNSDRPVKANIYGGGDAGVKIADLLSEIDLISHKTIVY
jgi:UDP-hydrolysing UDP-N-acetyl-D-glucosamine 2-epimerase